MKTPNRCVALATRHESDVFKSASSTISAGRKKANHHYIRRLPWYNTIDKWLTTKKGPPATTDSMHHFSRNSTRRNWYWQWHCISVVAPIFSLLLVHVCVCMRGNTYRSLGMHCAWLLPKPSHKHMCEQQT